MHSEEPPRRPRDWASLFVAAQKLRALTLPTERMEALVDLVWNSLAETGISWVGFYLDHPAQPDEQRMTLAARRPKPACSPIGMHGACGQSLRSAKVLVIRDVADLGAGYIACDPRDRSELVVPCLKSDGTAWAVFDLDSYELAAFHPDDGARCAELLVHAGLSDAQPVTELGPNRALK